jgi:hypothetical protein
VELSLERFDLFTVPAWRTSFDWLRPDLPALLADVDRLLDGSDLPAGYPGRQTRPVLQDLDGSHWARLFEGVRAVADGVVRSQEGRFATPGAQLRAVRSWALELVAPHDLRASRHSHAGATLSSVLWLELPSGTDPVGAGTRFCDPLGFVQPAQSPHATTVVAAEPLGLVVFPWWVEHHPMPNPSTGGGRRVVVATDLTYA